MYIPKNKIITDLYTDGGEYRKIIPNNVDRINLTNTSEIQPTYYVGYYWKSQTGDVYTGKNPNDKPQEKLIPSSNLSNLGPTEDLSDLMYSAGSDFQTPADAEEYGGGYNPNRISPTSFFGYVSSKGVTQNRKIPIHSYPLPNSKNYELGAYTRYFLQKITTKEFLEVTKDIYGKILRKDKNWVFELYQPFTIQWTISGEELEVQDANRNITLLTQSRLRTLGLTQFLENNYLQYYEEDVDLEDGVFDIEDISETPTSNAPLSPTPTTPSSPSSSPTPSSPSSPTSGGGY
jgi:hypothetical protein